MNNFDTIAAIATPLGAGGVGIVRISGDCAFEIARKIFSKDFQPQRITYGKLKDGNEILDEAILLAFKAPNSYSGEDVIEFQLHGSPALMNKVLQIVLKNGARLAERGEFTKRAFLNHKIDLSQAEAVLDIINAKTSEFAQAGVKNLSGSLNLKITQIKNEISTLLAKIIASLDFPDEVMELEYSQLEDSLESLIFQIEEILKNASSHNIARQGLKIALAGRPNVGKSSLFNALLDMERSIVTEIEGTTRDIITEAISIKGICATLVDTAGIRAEFSDKVEQIGIDFSLKAVQEADLILYLYEASGETEKDLEIYEQIKSKPHIKIAAKSDLYPLNSDKNLSISVKTRAGLEKLKQEIENKIINFDISQSEYITNTRQQDCLRRAKTALELALEGAQAQNLQDLISIDIKTALLSLSEITGEVLTDELLDRIFNEFCIGK